MAQLDPLPRLLFHDPVARLRHDHRVAQTSVDWNLIVRLRGTTTDRDGAARIVSFVCAEARVVVPRLGFHARRRPDTGHTRPPRRVVDALGMTGVDARRYPPEGHLQLSATPTLGTLAHELGHHLVNHLDPIRTPPHGNVWVTRQDAAATLVAHAVGW